MNDSILDRLSNLAMSMGEGDIDNKETFYDLCRNLTDAPC